MVFVRRWVSNLNSGDNRWDEKADALIEPSFPGRDRCCWIKDQERAALDYGCYQGCSGGELEIVVADVGLHFDQEVEVVSIASSRLGETISHRPGRVVGTVLLFSVNISRLRRSNHSQRANPPLMMNWVSVL